MSRLEAEKLELTGSLCSMQQKQTELETIVLELEDERVTVALLVLSELLCMYAAGGTVNSFDC